MMKKFVAVAGNIGVGKSTLVEMVCQRLRWKPFFEPVTDNPYLPDFYNDMQTWAFHSQIFFLTNRLRAHRNLLDHPTSVIQDRSVYEDAEVFACNLYRQKQMSARDYNTYRELYRVLSEFLPPPDLVVYLRASVPTLQRRIRHRGRNYERQIESSYLDQLNNLYETWIENFSLCPVLTIPADNLDFVENRSHLDLIVQKVQEKLSGKDEVIFKYEDIVNGRSA
jgi:deoxyadenosine/deoxycytidine kinase